MSDSYQYIISKETIKRFHEFLDKFPDTKEYLIDEEFLDLMGSLIAVKESIECLEREFLKNTI